MEKQLTHLFNLNNIQTRPVWHLNHKQKMFNKFQKYKIKQAPKLISNSLCLPSSTNLNKSQIHKIIDLLLKYSNCY